MEIRILEVADIGAIHALATEAESEGFRFVTRLLNDLASGAAQLETESEFFKGIFDRDSLVALGGITPDPYIDDHQVGRVRHVFVTRAYRGRGVGRLLMRSIEAQASGRYRRLRLRTDSAAAAAFYERLGYARVTQESATHERTCQA
jgi:GNAT superfamily N-acetyltransferase